MPIEFHCSECNQFLRTPDGTEGKNAKCPKCGALVMVPATAAPSPPTPTPGPEEASPFAGIGGPSSGVESDNPFAGISESSGSTAPPPDPSNPYAPPGLVSDYGYGLGPSGKAERTGPPWEREGKSVDTFWRTAKEVVGEPTGMFRRMRRTGGLGNPFWFACAGTLVGIMSMLGYYFLLIGAISMIGGGARVVGMVVGMFLCLGVFMAVLSPVFIFLILLINAGITHLLLMMVGGAKQGFETTFRVVAYANGATCLLLMIPCGFLFQGIASFVYRIIGLAAAHEISGGKAALAVLLPVFICIGLHTILIMMGVFANLAGPGGFPM